MQLDAPEPRIAVKLPPETGAEYRALYDGVLPAYHMNKTHWNSVILDGTVPDEEVRSMIARSYDLAGGKR